MTRQKIMRFRNEDDANVYLQSNPQWRAVSISAVCETMSELQFSAPSSSIDTQEYPYSYVSSSYDVLVLFESIE